MVCLAGLMPRKPPPGPAFKVRLPAACLDSSLSAIGDICEAGSEPVQSRRDELPHIPGRRIANGDDRHVQCDKCGVAQ